MTKFSKLFLFIIITIMAVSCGNKADMIKAGSICTIDDGEGKFGVVKVLVINDQEAHIKIYKNKYDQRPSKIDLKTLSLGSINDKDGNIGIGHVPLERKGFDSWKPVIVDFEEVTKDDLVGYEFWKNNSN
ncbi:MULTISPECIES: hypothetical protein [Niastella]|uniref:DUF2141 domain-containing protein n=1 Tax=Niastella soli TaxID=2821487 RepID=A0ABS3YXZ8_9BACT|nr:hypothetical protein [Niastella soli]MBO9202800.1 hypothetical protein [Niastella soli]